MAPSTRILPSPRALSSLGAIARDIKLAHTVFALPFAVMSAFLAAEGWPGAKTLLWILVAMVSARSAAMAFNRLVDHALDSENPRTRERALPAGRVGRGAMGAFTLVSAAVFVFATATLNDLCFALSLPVLAVLLGYSLTKRFTTLAHVVLGTALGLAPLGAWLAVTGSFGDRPLIPLALAAAVTCWVAGFDIIYSCQDAAFDRRKGLYSLPSRLGVLPALRLSALLHVVMVILLALIGGMTPGLGGAYFAGVAAVAALLAYEHYLVASGNLSKIDLAFFNMNGVVSLVLMTLALVDVLVD